MSKKTVLSFPTPLGSGMVPTEEHHLRLVDLIDQVLDLFDTDPDYRYFHLDGPDHHSGRLPPNSSHQESAP